MLERTAGCLETGSLRRLLPGPKHLVKSRRTLHSGFWTHGAIALELSPLWQLMLQASSFADSSNQKSPDGISSENPGAFLDFLYPANTLGFLRRYSDLGGDRQDGKRTGLGLRSSGYRPYTSSAKNTSLALVPVDAKTKDSNEAKKTVETKKRSVLVDVSDDAATIATVLGISTSSRYEEVWRKYRLLLFGSWEEERIRSQVAAYMAASNRIIDSERATALFEKCDDRRETPEVYESIIRAYLRLQNLSRANELYQHALEKFNTTAGGSEIMFRLMANSLWSQAFSLWIKVQPHAKKEYDIFKRLNHLQDLPSRALSLAKYVNESTRDSSKSDFSLPSIALVKFATSAIMTTLLSAEHFSHITFWPLLKHIRNWGTDSVVLYAQATHMLIYSLEEAKAAITLYRQARESQERKLILPANMLFSVLRLFLKHDDIVGIQEVIEDIFRFNQTLDRKSLRACMNHFARHGDVESVQALFEQLERRYMQLPDKTAKVPNPLASADDMAALLHVHARRGEVEKVIEVFKSIRGKYRLKPTITCCNILISAYAQVHEFDKAFESFEYTITVRKLEPDDYTFGTLMGMCTSHGDLLNTVELYRMSAAFGVEKSAAMVSTLVTAYIAEGRLEEAETLCEEAMSLKFKKPRTRMWNSLLVAWALKYDLANVNRILQRMSKLNVEHDGDTYAALMQALAMVKQPERAWEILSDVMPEAGIFSTTLHYAIVMGGFLSVRRYDMVFWVQEKMLKKKLMKNASTKFLELRASIHAARKKSGDAYGAMDIFEQVVQTMSPRDLSDKVRKGFQPSGRQPLNVTYPATFFGYLIFVLSKYMETRSAQDVHERFLKMIPLNADSKPRNIITSLMSLKLQERDYGAVESLWMQIMNETQKRNKSFRLPGVLKELDSEKGAEAEAADNLSSEQTVEEGISGGIHEKREPIKASHRFDLIKPLHPYFMALSKQGKIKTMIATVNELTASGFQLSSQNWNEYIQHLAKAGLLKSAFQTCELVLMDGWKGWSKVRAQSNETNRLPLEIRRKGMHFTALRPDYRTLLHLTNGFLRIQAMAAESRANRFLLNDLEHDCAKTLKAIKTMIRSGDALEREILGW